MSFNENSKILVRTKNQKTDYDDIIPSGIIFNLAELQNMKVLKVSTAKKLINNGELEIVKVGNKIHVSRAELIKFLETNTF